ncbi:MAG: hypothetical protein JWM12_442 [Ilumatobacteraceae bacterium]|jgi:hypothetical protein|nr:hypothetical protein [Ilumatobacteraceae bacterium]
MTVTPHELLAQMASTFRHEIGPAVDEPFAKTQAFMAAVILSKLAGQLQAAEADAQAAGDERRAVVAALRARLGSACPARLGDALTDLGHDGSDAAWSRLVGSLYAERDGLGADEFDALLGVVRSALRARLDRALAYAS